MDLFGKRNGMLMLGILSAGLLACVIWQFALGGRSSIKMDLVPVNEDMRTLLAESGAQIGAAHSPLPQEAAPAAAEPASAERRSAEAASGAAPNAAESVGPQAAAASPASATSAAQPVAAAPPGASTPLSKNGQASPPQGVSLDLNTATLEQLDQLPGIGASKAKAILDYRAKRGRFDRVEQLTEVKGIGAKMLEKLKPFVYVSVS